MLPLVGRHIDLLLLGLAIAAKARMGMRRLLLALHGILWSVAQRPDLGIRDGENVQLQYLLVVAVAQKEDHASLLRNSRDLSLIILKLERNETSSITTMVAYSPFRRPSTWPCTSRPSSTSRRRRATSRSDPAELPAAPTYPAPGDVDGDGR